MATKRRNQKKHARTQNRGLKIASFAQLNNRHIPSKGIHFFFEKVDVVSDDPTLKGDLVKKYKNGKLVEQKFVTEDKMNEIAHNQINKSEMAMEGGRAKKVVYVQGPAPQAQPQQVQMQNNTSMGTVFKQSFAGGAGATLGIEAMSGILGAVFGSDNE
jgi:hypothetical protein